MGNKTPIGTRATRFHRSLMRCLIIRRTLMRRSIIWCAVALGCVFFSREIPRALAQENVSQETRSDVMFAHDRCTVDRLEQLAGDTCEAVVLMVPEDLATNEPSRVQYHQAAERVRRHGKQVAAWIEVARCPSLAKRHPLWMASLQGHTEWRRLFPDATDVDASQGEVVKTYPWVPIQSDETYTAQLQRVRQLIDSLPRAEQIYLNGLQGSPSACGCGNTLCRWTTDYGPLRTTTPNQPSAAAEFVAAIEKSVPDCEVIPVWVTECEQHDGAADGACAGVGCFEGICWKAYTEQLMPVVEQSKRIAALLALRDFDRDLKAFSEPAGWTRHALGTFQSMPPRRGGKSIAAERITAVLQAWDVDDVLVQAQIKQARIAGSTRILLAHDRIDQSWSPRPLHLGQR